MKLQHALEMIRAKVLDQGLVDPRLLLTNPLADQDICHTMDADGCIRTRYDDTVAGANREAKFVDGSLRVQVDDRTMCFVVWARKAATEILEPVTLRG